MHLNKQLVLAALLLGCGSVTCQEYIQQSPSPTDMHLTAIEFVNSDSGWVTASWANSGGLFETADAGQSWDTVLIREVERFDALDMIDDSTGYAAGDALYKTTDGWQTWTRTELPAAPQGTHTGVSSMQFVDASTGWLSTRPSGAQSYLYSTTDGGANWTYLGTFELDSWKFNDASIGWAALLDHTFVRTNDGGLSWTPVQMPAAITTSSDVIEVFSYDEAIVTTFQDAETRFSMHKTSDGGATWDSSLPGVPRDAVFTDQMNGYGFEQFGTYSSTTDGGMSWTEDTEAGIGHEKFTCVSVLGDSVYLGGEYGYITASADNGATWSQISKGSGQDLRRVGFADSQHGWVTGDGTILGTTDGGETWNHLPGPVLTNFFQLFHSGPADVWPFSATDVAIRWNSVNLIRTTDGGQSWTLEDPDDIWPDGRIYVLDSDTYFKYDPAGRRIHKSTDAGQTWTAGPATVPPLDAGDTILDFYFYDEMNGWIIGSPIIAFHTQDGGQTWTETAQIIRLPSPVYRRVRFVTPDIGWMVGSYGLILRTTDGGDTWIEQTQPDTFDDTNIDLVAISETEAYLAGVSDGQSMVKRTTDAGATWIEQYTSTFGAHGNATANNGLAVFDGNVWTSGIFGSILHGQATGDCLADVNNDGTLTPTDFTAWIAAFNSNAPGCDQNGDGSCTPTDFTAWVANFNAGC